MNNEPPNNDFCISCDRDAVIQYRYRGVQIGACQRHWNMHCHPLVPYSLRKECERYLEVED